VLGSIGIIGLGLVAFQIESGFYGLLCSGMGMLVVVVALQLFPILERRESIKHLSVAARETILPGELMTFYKCRKYAPVFYLPDRVYCCDPDQEPNRFDHPDDLLKFTSSTESLLVILPSALRPELETDPRFQVQYLESEFIFSLVRVRRHPELRPN
jgi:hypothetical protein